jgi:hypothetical protein
MRTECLVIMKNLASKIAPRTVLLLTRIFMVAQCYHTALTAQLAAR